MGETRNLKKKLNKIAAQAADAIISWVMLRSLQNCPNRCIHAVLNFFAPFQIDVITSTFKFINRREKLYL